MEVDESELSVFSPASSGRVCLQSLRMEREERAEGGEKRVNHLAGCRPKQGSECIIPVGQTDLRGAAGVDGHAAASVSGRRYGTEDGHPVTNNRGREINIFILSSLSCCTCQRNNMQLKHGNTKVVQIKFSTSAYSLVFNHPVLIQSSNGLGHMTWKLLKTEFSIKIVI